MKNLKNYHSLKAVVSALTGNAVKQLKTTYLELNSQVKEELDQLQKFIDPSNIRKSLKSLAEPYIPPLEIILEDITRLEDDLPNEINGLYNVEKRFLIYQAMEPIRKAASGGVRKYLLRHVDQIQNLFVFGKISISEEELVEEAKKAESQK